MRGSCLCGGVRFEIDGKVSPISQCHCSLCRKASGAAFNAVLITAMRSFRWVAGEDLGETWRRRSGWRHTFCRVCGSTLPGIHSSGKIVQIPVGSLDDDPGTAIARHIFVGSKAAWDEIAGDAARFEEYAPE